MLGIVGSFIYCIGQDIYISQHILLRAQVVLKKKKKKKKKKNIEIIA